MIRPCMSGRSFLYGLRPSVQTFPMWQALPASEYYAVSATSKHELSRLGYSTHVLSHKKPEFDIYHSLMEKNMNLSLIF